ncbi:MAG: 50S ribosomal protein L25 [Candidatus Tectomicrobia bacterium]|nr:50S ribosomal protein L25 [Candidatus Tectomicrobia bacterium]
MEAPVLRAWRRNRSGKGVARKIRAQGMIPAVLYGGGENIPLSLPPQELLKILSSGENTIFRLEIDGERAGDRQVIVRDLQRDPLKDSLLHADLYRISMDVEITVSVPIVLQGMSREVSDVGGVINQLLHEVEIQCLPGLIPHELTVDVAHLGIGEVLHVRDLPVPQGIQVLVDADEVVASVSVRGEEVAAGAPSTAEAPAAEAEAEGI